MVVQRWSFPTGHLPLPDWHLRLYGSWWDSPIVLVCVLGSALLGAPVAAASAVFLVILSVKVLSLMLCLLVSLVLLTTCLYSKQNTISLCIRSTCSVLLGYSVDLFSLLCGSLVTSSLSVRQLKTKVKTMVTSLDKKKTYNIVAAHGYFGRLIFNTLPSATPVRCTSSWQHGCCRYLVHCTWFQWHST